MNYFSPEETTALPAGGFSHLLAEQQGPVLTLTLNRPEKKNALNPLLIRELAFALSYAHATQRVWVVVLRAAGNVFCAGMDMKALQSGEAPPTALPEPRREIRLYELVASLHKPCVAVLTAPVYAGGLLLLAGCTHVLATESAVLSLPEVKRGLFPFQVLDALTAIGCPQRAVLDACLRGRPITAAEAQRWGLVTEVGEPESLLSTYLTDLLAGSPAAQQAGLAAWQQARTLPAAERQGFFMDAFVRSQRTDDAREGMAAFLEKRPPVWTNR